MTAKGSDTLAEARLGPQLRVLDGIASWCGGLHGAMPLAEALQALARGFGAESAAISRHLKTEDRPRAVAITDARGDDQYLPSLTRPLAPDVLGYLYDKARASTLWFLGDHLDDPQWELSQTLSNWRASREIAEIVVIVLASNAQQTDIVEFHFSKPLERSEKLEFDSLLPTIVRSWAGRRTGLVTQARMDARDSARARSWSRRIASNGMHRFLGMSNPAGLSRAEFRVCLLLSRGLSVKGVTDELGLTEATVRTHLRSIYAKTETSSLAELSVPHPVFRERTKRWKRAPRDAPERASTRSTSISHRPVWAARDWHRMISPFPAAPSTSTKSRCSTSPEINPHLQTPQSPSEHFTSTAIPFSASTSVARLVGGDLQGQARAR